MNLKTDYKDEILKEGEIHRTYNIVSDAGEVLFNNVHLEKAYVPFQEGDDFGAVDVNTITGVLNKTPVILNHAEWGNGNEVWIFDNGMMVMIMREEKYITINKAIGKGDTMFNAGAVYRFPVGAIPQAGFEIPPLIEIPHVFLGRVWRNGKRMWADVFRVSDYDVEIQYFTADKHEYPSTDTDMLTEIMVIGRWK